jgi:PP-loop superfamily ATP-utilizing enzyme
MRKAVSGRQYEAELPVDGDAAICNPQSAPGLARIEVGPAELPKLLAAGTAARVAEALKQIGYAHVTVDLQGYRRGSLNELGVSNNASVLTPVGQA